MNSADLEKIIQSDVKTDVYKRHKKYLRLLILGYITILTSSLWMPYLFRTLKMLSYPGHPLYKFSFRYIFRDILSYFKDPPFFNKPHHYTPITFFIKKIITFLLSILIGLKIWPEFLKRKMFRYTDEHELEYIHFERGIYYPCVIKDIRKKLK